MKKFIVPFLASMMFAGCSSVQSARDALAEMPEVEYQELKVNVRNVSEHAGRSLARLLDDQGRVDLAMLVTRNIKTSIMFDVIDVNDVVQGVLDHYDLQLGLTEEQLGHISDAAKVIDAAVGQIRLGIDGKLSDREKDLLVTLLDGVLGGLEEGPLNQ